MTTQLCYIHHATQPRVGRAVSIEFELAFDQAAEAPSPFCDKLPFYALPVARFNF